MSTPNWTLVELREDVARVFGMTESTATATGSTSTLIDSKMQRYADNYWNGAQIYIKTDAGGASAAPQGENSYVTGFDVSGTPTTATFTFSPVLTDTPALGDTYQLYRHVTYQDIDRAVARNIAGQEVATSLTARDDTLDYCLYPNVGLHRLQQITGVWVRKNKDVLVLPEKIVGYQLEDAEGVLWLRMPYTLSESDGLWVTYVMGEDASTWDAATDAVSMPPELVKARCCIYLIEQLLPNQDGAGMDRWGQMLRYWQEKLVGLERQLQRPQRVVWQPAWSVGHGGSLKDQVESAGYYASRP